VGYEVHITRREHWSDEGSDIGLDEWTAYVSSDPDMRMDGFAETETPEGAFRVDSAGLAVWARYPGHAEDGNMAWFYYCRGNVNVKNPDKEIIQKMLQVSESLGAGVQGDDGEFYDVAGGLESRSGSPTGKKWWQFWK
jgi:hypothetical protein